MKAYRGLYLETLFYPECSVDIHQTTVDEYRLYLYWGLGDGAYVGRVSRLELAVLERQAQKVVWA